MVSYSFEGNKRFWTACGEENEKIFSQQSKPEGVASSPDIMPNYLANAECDVEKWPLVHLLRLLRFYAGHRCLWDVGCKDNRNRKLRHAAIVDITTALDIGVNKEQVVQKINILRATYRYEKKRIKQRMRRGLGARTKLKWFAVADAFLRNVPKKGKKIQDPSNSDSDLEDAIVITICPESLMSTEKEIVSQTFKEQQNTKPFLKTKPEIFSNDSQFRTGLELNQHKGKCNQISQEVGYSVKKKSWTIKDTLIFLQLLENNSALSENPFESCEHYQTLLELIAKEMNCFYKSIEKRWFILQKTFKEEKQKIVENPQYKPQFKWWSQAEKLFAKTPFPIISSSLTDRCENVPTEFIFLQENINEETDDENEYENRFLENPIPSVAPSSNINEAMASLFHTNNDEDFSQESNTESIYPEEKQLLSSADKFVWNGLEDDLLEGKWSLKYSVKFLRLYGVHRCLWDLNDPDYRSRPLRNAAIEDIAACMGHGLTASYVAKKIKIFRITYMQQRKRLLEATEKNDKPEILLKWFPLADSFLRPHIGLRSIKSDAKEMPQFDYQHVYANLNLIDPGLLTDFRGKGTQNAIEIGNDSDVIDMEV